MLTEICTIMLAHFKLFTRLKTNLRLQSTFRKLKSGNKQKRRNQGSTQEWIMTSSSKLRAVLRFVQQPQSRPLPPLRLTPLLRELSNRVHAWPWDHFKKQKNRELAERWCHLGALASIWNLGGRTFMTCRLQAGFLKATPFGSSGRACHLSSLWDFLSGSYYGCTFPYLNFAVNT